MTRKEMAVEASTHRDIAADMIGIADASRRVDGTDIPLGKQCREAAAEIERLREALEEVGALADAVGDPEALLRQIRRAVRAALASEPEPSPSGGAESGEKPVAWRVKDFADGWVLYHTEEAAIRLHMSSVSPLVQPLYTRPAPDIAADFRRGAEAMREAAAQEAFDQTCDHPQLTGDWNAACEHIAKRIRVLPEPVQPTKGGGT